MKSTGGVANNKKILLLPIGAQKKMFYGLLADTAAQSTQLSLSDFINIISICISIPIVAIIGSIVAFIRGHSKRKFFRIYADDCLGLKYDENLRGARYRFKHYTAHTLTEKDGEKSAINISFNKFCKQISKNKITVIIGPSGIGKSILMQKLAYKFRNKKLKKNSAEIKDYGIIYYGKADFSILKEKIKGDESIAQVLLDDIDEKRKDSTNYNIYIDGLDELLLIANSDEKGESGDKLITEFFKGINIRTSKFKRFVVSLRPEIAADFDEGYIGKNISEDYDNLHKPKTQIWEVDRFTNKKILQMYKKESRLSRESLAQRSQNAKKLKTFLNSESNKNKETVFSFPFIITWLPEIFDNVSVSDLANFSWYDVLKLIVDNDAGREAGVLEDELDEKEKKFFIENFHKTIASIALFMGENKNEALTADEVARACNNSNIKEIMEALSRRLLIVTETAEGQKYQFIHNLIYWFVLANAIADVDFGRERRLNILNYYSTTPLAEFYNNALWEKYNECFSYYAEKSQNVSARAKNEFIQAVKDKRILCHSTQNISHEQVLSLLHEFDYITLDGIEYTLGGTVLKKYPVNKGDLSFTVSAPVEEILEGAFKCNSILKSIIIGNTVKRIGQQTSKLNLTADSFFKEYLSKYTVIDENHIGVGNGAFSNCNSLKNVIIGEKVEVIGYQAFAFCPCIEKISIPNKVAIIDKAAFAGCTALKRVDIGCSVNVIDIQAFCDCISLYRIDIPNKVSYIGLMAFHRCGSLNNVIIGRGVKTIEVASFLGCLSLKSIEVDKDNKFYSSIDGNLYSKDGKTLIQYAIGKKVSEVSIPDTVTIIFNMSFHSSSIESIEIPDNVTAIESAAFLRCNALKKVIIGKGVNIIGLSAFTQCDSLAEVYYRGNKEDWNKISIDKNNEPLLNATKYYYSESEPDFSDGEKYWHYGEDGEILIWGEDTTDAAAQSI